MLSPEYLRDITISSELVAEELHNSIIKKAVQRLKKRFDNNYETLMSGYDKYQLESLQEAGYLLTDLVEEISKYTGILENELYIAIEQAGILNLANENTVYKELGCNITSRQSPFIMDLIKRNYNKTKATMRNYTATVPARGYEEYIRVTDKAYIQAMSGAISPQEAVHDAVMELSNKVGYVKYDSGHIDTIETAVTRAVRTGVSQTSTEMTLEMLERNNMDIVLVSAHLGARYGDGGANPGNHEWWQGKYYSRTGKSRKFLPLSVTGIGTGEGLGGWNCRHSIGAGTGKKRNNPYNKLNTKSEQNKKEYDLSQEQRRKERDIRERKRKVIALQEEYNNTSDYDEKAMLKTEIDRQSYLLQEKFKAYTKWCYDNNRKPRYSSVEVGAFENTVNSQSIVNARKYATIDAREVVRNRIQSGEYSLKLSKQKYNKHVEGTTQYEQYASAREIPQSKLLISYEEAQEMINKYACSGKFRISSTGKVMNTEWVTVDKVIGKYCDNNGRWHDTNRAQIMYSKTSAHIIPVKEKNMR